MKTINVWDNFTRIYHLSQLSLLALLWYSGSNADFELHFICAFILMGLWFTRVIWGFIGSSTSRFTHFIKSPLTVLMAWKNNTIAQPHIGHNPIAGYMVLFLLLSLALQLFTGLFASDDVFAEGPLYVSVSGSFADKMDSLHHSNFDVLLILIVIHALAAMFHVLRGDNVIASIFTGKKRLVSNEVPTIKSAFIPLLVWAISSYFLINWGLSASSF